MSNNKNIGELIPIENKNGQQAVNARYLYEWLGIRKDFTHWMKAQIIRCDLTELVDYQAFAQKVECKNGVGYTIKTDYALSINAAKEISMMSQTEKGKQARRYFIECEKQLREQRAVISSGTSRNLPMNYTEALEQLLENVKRNTQLQIENERLADDLNTQHNINNLLQGENDTLKTKAMVYDQVINTPQDNDLSTVSAVANEIGMSGKKLNKMLVACGVIYKAPNGDYLFTSDYRDWGLGKMVSALVNEGKGLVRTYIKWNTRGRAYIHALHSTNWDKRRAWHLLRYGKEVAAV